MSTNHKDSKLIWDLPLRIWHWCLVLAIGYSWYSVKISGDMDHHFIAGHCTLALLTFRILWGWAGTRYAKFKSFIFPPKKIFTQLKQLLLRQPEKHAGHSPLGGLSVLTLITLITIQVSTGLFANDGYYIYGPLAEKIEPTWSTYISNLHNLNSSVLLGFIGLHIFSVIFYFVLKKENLILPMFSGKKPDLDKSVPAIKNSKLLLSLVLIGITSAASYFIFNIN